MALRRTGLRFVRQLMGCNCNSFSPAASNFSTCSQARQLSASSLESSIKRGNRRLEVDLEELTAMQFLDRVTLIDVRQPAELSSQEQIPGSLHIPLGNLRDAFQLSEQEWSDRFSSSKPVKGDRAIVFYARGPIASSAAVEIAHKMGYKKSRHYAGGWADYCARHNMPVTKGKENDVELHYNYHYYNPDLHYL